jgi:hypothetical protein
MSAPIVKMTMNEAEFNRVLERVYAESSRTFPEFLNGQGLKLATTAIQQTEKADTNKIAWSLGQTDRRYVNKRTGKALKMPKRVFGSSAASLNLYRIVNWRRVRANKKPLGGTAMSKPARALRAASLKSTGFISSGWVTAVRGLSRIAGYADRKSVTMPRATGDPKGYVTPATRAIDAVVSCVIGNTALLGETAARTGSRKGAPMRKAERGLSVARDLTAKDMLAHLARKLQPVLNKFAGK